MKMNNEAKLLQDYVNFVDSTKKRNTYYKMFIFLISYNCIFVFILSLI